MAKKIAPLFAKSTDSARGISYASFASDPGVMELALEKIKPRAQKDVRDLNVNHAIELAETIAAAGLLEPIVLDTRYRLLAGLHRHAAWQLLVALGQVSAGQRSEEVKKIAASIFGNQELAEQQLTRISVLDTDSFQKHHTGGRVPCRVMPFDAEQDPKRALEVEVAENEKRRDFSKAEIAALVENLKQRGFVEAAGRPAKGVRPLTPMLQLILCKSRRQVTRLLADTRKPPAQVEPPASQLPGLVRAIERALPELKASRSAQWKAAAQYFEKGQEMIQGLIKS